MVCPFLWNIKISVVQNVVSFRNCRNPPPPTLSKHLTISWCCRLSRFLKKKSSKHPIVFCLLNRKNSCNESCGGREATCTCFESHLKTRTDEFSCLFRNYLTIHRRSESRTKLPITNFLVDYRCGLGRNDGRCPANQYKYHIPVVFQSLLLYRPRLLSTSYTFPWKQSPICTKILHKSAFGDIEFWTPSTHAVLKQRKSLYAAFNDVRTQC